MKNGTLEDVTGKWVRDCFEELWRTKDEGGCCSICFDTDDRYRYCVCIGWIEGYDKTPGSPDGWRVGWKIGRQTHNNVMQCDMDIDFEMPYNDDYVDDTEEAIETRTVRSERVPKYYESWDALAAEMRRQGARVFNEWRDQRGDQQ